MNTSMRLVLDTHGAEQMSARGLDISMLLDLQLHRELVELPKGKKLTKTINGTTMVFKKSNSSNTIYIKTGWATYAPINVSSYTPKGRKSA